MKQLANMSLHFMVRLIMQIQQTLMTSSPSPSASKLSIMKAIKMLALSQLMLQMMGLLLLMMLQISLKMSLA